MRVRTGIFKMFGLCLLAGVLVAGVLFPVVGGLGVASNQASDTVINQSAVLADQPPPLVTTVTDRAGNPIATLYDQYRIPTAPHEISDAMKWAIISIEDRRFYEHRGVDWKGTLRAAISNSSGGDTQGASTLTQQYVKNYLINVIYRKDELGQQRAQEVSIARKLREAQTAIQLETKMTKDEVLAGYLNIIEFSRQVYGVGAAARAYFDTTADKLTVPQAALLAGVVNNPTALDPWNNPEEATKRRNVVLDTMVENLKLSEADAEEIKKQPLGVVPGGPKKPPANCIGAGPEHGFFCQYVEDYLIDNGMSKDQLYTGGYTIRTTLDPRANHLAKESAERQVDKAEPNVANTLSLVKPGKKRHEVLALAANRDYGTNREAGQTTYALPSDIMNKTGAGSSFKIFTAAAALEQGKAKLFDSVAVPGSYTSSVFIGGGDHCPTLPSGVKAYCVANAGDYPGSMSLQDALAQSPNTAFVVLEEKTGMQAVLNMAHRLGLRKTMMSNGDGKPPNPKADNPVLRGPQKEVYGPNGNYAGVGAFTLGFSPVSPLEMANVAATIMSDGKWCPPTPIAEIRDRNGNHYPIREQPCEQVVPPGLARTMAAGLSKDIEPGGTAAAAANDAQWSRPMIGKTGTTQHQGSAAFIGGTPQVTGAAMIFKPDYPAGGLCDAGPGNVSDCGTGNMFGGRTPARTWFGAVKPYLAGEPVLPLPKAGPRYS